MEYTEHKLTMDVHKTVSNASVSLKKGDTAHRLMITLSEGGYPYHIGEDCTAAFSALKPDGTAIFNDCRIEGDTVIYDMTEQTTAEEGMVSCEIQIYGAGGALLTSASFLLFVEEGVNNRGAVVSSGEFSTLASMVREVNRATSQANRATERANKAATACKVIGSAEGEMIWLDDAIDALFVGMRIFGKTTQNGIPTPANPATLVSVGDLGSINLTSNEQTITIPISGGLHGIPVASGGNYTDSNGQQWVCDEIDVGRGVYVQRCKVIEIDGTGAIGVNQHTNSQCYCSKSVPDIINLTPPDIPKMVMSDKYEASVWTNQNNMVYCIGTSIVITDSRFTNMEATIAILQAERPKVVYVLAKPIETDLPDEVLDDFQSYIRSHSGDTVVSNDADAHMALEYIMDARKYIDKMISTGIHEATLE